MLKKSHIVAIKVYDRKTKGEMPDTVEVRPEHEKFATAWIRTHRDPTRGQGIHTKMTNAVKDEKGDYDFNDSYNAQFRAVFPNDDPVKVELGLEALDVLDGRPSTGGRLIYLKGEMPASNSRAPSTTDPKEIMKALGIKA